MKRTPTAILLATHSLLQSAAGQGQPALTPQTGGFRGIWFELGQKSEHGDKYSSRLGTYTANHVPMAHYVKKVRRTYLTWGGTPAADQRRLQILVSYYDHNTGKAARPVVVMDKGKVDAPHDNGSLSIDGEGHLWIFVSGRGTKRPGRIYRSKSPYEINDWINLGDSEFTYPQPWWFEGRGFLHTYTRYTHGRELYFRTSRDGLTWDAEKRLAGLEGHYQTSEQVGERLITASARPAGGAEAPFTLERRSSMRTSRMFGRAESAARALESIAMTRQARTRGKRGKCMGSMVSLSKT